MGDWQTWFQDVSKMAIGSYTELKYKAPLELEKMRLQALGPYGDTYIEGAPVVNPHTQIIPGVSNALLLVVGAAALIFALKD